MQVSCPQCSSVYEFDSSAIPAQGYDAQCASCGGVFFVSPDGGTNPAATAPAGPNQTSVSCPHCSAIYQFEIDAIPAGGYDAQCTQCNNTFFVDDPRAGGSGVSSQSGSIDSGVGVIDDVMSIGDGEIEPMGIPEHTDTSPALDDYDDEDDDLYPPKSKLPKFIGFGVVALLLYTGGTYMFARGLFDHTVGALLGVSSAPPEAEQAYNEGIEAMYHDTRAGYQAATKHFEAALEVDPAFANALGMKGLAQVLMGQDIQEAGRRFHAEGSKATLQRKKIEALAEKKRSDEDKQRLEELTQEVSAYAKQASEKLKEGGELTSAGLEDLKAALKLDETPTVYHALGLYYAARSDGRKKAKQMQVRAHNKMDPVPADDIATWGDPWALILEGRIRVLDVKQEAKAAFERALEVEPKFQRARFELAKWYQSQNNIDEAKSQAQKILDDEDDHAKAVALLKELESPPPEVQAGDEKPATKKANKSGRKKKKKKRRKGRRRKKRRR